MVTRNRARRRRTLPTGVYTLKDASRILGVKKPQVEYWARRRAVIPQLSSDGPGNYRHYSFANLIELEICRVMAAAGVPVSEFRDATELTLKDLDPDDWEAHGPRHVETLGEPPVVDESRVFSTIADQLTYALNHAVGSDAIAQLFGAALARWRQFKSPDARGDLKFFLVRSRRSGDECALWFLAPEDQMPYFISKSDELYVIALRPVFERIERATHDRWRSWKDLRE
ncbi:MAG: MerR family transcriptional regulator [Vicinamibacterales bacterium]